MEDRPVAPGSDIDLALQRALESANLRAGGAPAASVVATAEDREPTAVESGDLHAGPDAD